jgi:hypothetical protein
MKRLFFIAILLLLVSVGGTALVSWCQDEDRHRIAQSIQLPERDGGVQVDRELLASSIQGMRWSMFYGIIWSVGICGIGLGVLVVVGRAKLQRILRSDIIVRHEHEAVYVVGRRRIVLAGKQHEVEEEMRLPVTDADWLSLRTN